MPENELSRIFTRQFSKVKINTINNNDKTQYKNKCVLFSYWNMNEENNVLTIKTVQIQPIRNMITAIKDVLTDATITFTKDAIVAHIDCI
jgi:hypothetical protein